MAFSHSSFDSILLRLACSPGALRTSVAETRRSNFKISTAQPDGATLSGQSADADADGVQSTGTKAGLFWDAMEWVGCGIRWLKGCREFTAQTRGHLELLIEERTPLQKVE